MAGVLVKIYPMRYAHLTPVMPLNYWVMIAFHNLSVRTTCRKKAALNEALVVAVMLWNSFQPD